MDVSAISQKVNGGGHLYEGSKYAHFSQITEHNKHLFPLFDRARGAKIILEAGDCLFIPRKWWHWVKSFASTENSPRCISINFWFSPQEQKSPLDDDKCSSFVDFGKEQNFCNPLNHDAGEKDISLSRSEEQAFRFDFLNSPSPDILAKPFGDRSVPIKFCHAIDDWKALDRWQDDYLIEKIDSSIPEGLWLFLNEGACAKRISLADFIQKYAPDKKQNSAPDVYAYLITPSDYEPRKEKHNAKIIDILKEDFHSPFPQEMEGADANFWMNFGKIDTGLHYDDEDGLLCVVKGRKEVLLFPPSDSEFLYPYPLQPVKLAGYHKVFHYNLYIELPISLARDESPIGSNGDQIGKSLVTSAQLLEVCLQRAPNVARVAQKLQEKFGAGRIVYGIKNTKGVVKYEFYFYGLDKTKQVAPVRGSYYASASCNKDFHLLSYLEETHSEFFPNDHYNLSKLDMTNLCIWSIDLTEESLLNGSTSHLNLYYACEDRINLPIVLAEKTCLKNGNVKLRSVSYTDRFENVLLNEASLRHTCLKLGLTNNDISCLINFVNGSPYKCEYISIFNKGAEIGIYFYGIEYQSFLNFLITYDYPVGLITLVDEHPHEISQLKLEVGFHFLKGEQTKVPCRSAFYGLF